MGRYGCPGCSHVYDEMQGDPREGFPPGTTWSAIPERWCCPDCAVREKPDFVELDGVLPGGEGSPQPRRLLSARCTSRGAIR